MSASAETQLWVKLLFESDLAAQRAKGLLLRWQKQNLTLQQVARKLRDDARNLGLTAQEARELLPALGTQSDAIAPPALRWDEAGYPTGLRDLPLKLRPALLFYAGDVGLLSRPIVYLEPAPISPEVESLMPEIASALLGEGVLPAAFEGSPPAALLLEEMAHSEGEALLFARSGIERVELPETAQAWMEAGRLLVISPLPPQAPDNPKWEPVLRQLARAAAARCITADAAAALDSTGPTPTLLLSYEAPPRAANIPHLQVVHNAFDMLLWLTDLTPTPGQPAEMPAIRPTVPAEAPLAAPPTELEPPPTPEEALRILEKGGKVPEALRKRLLEQDQ